MRYVIRPIGQPAKVLDTHFCIYVDAATSAPRNIFDNAEAAEAFAASSAPVEVPYCIAALQTEGCAYPRTDGVTPASYGLDDTTPIPF